MAATGSAIGLGNLWKFPYLAGRNGGALFLLLYLFFLILLGVPILMSEMALGRSTRKNAIDAYAAISPKWRFAGMLGVLCAFLILSYYSVVGGWVMKYISAFLTGGVGEDTAGYFDSFVSRPAEPILWHFAFMVVCLVIVTGGISKGIERVSKLLLPALLLFIVILAVYGLTLDGAMEGVRFFLVPDFSAVHSVGDLGEIVLHAVGQVFFSLSLGMGTIITYGSYLGGDARLQKSAVAIPMLDTLVAVLAGFATLPAVFAFGFAPQGGPGLIFQTLPAVFQDMRFGVFFGLLFFLLVFFAAVTSGISLLEVVASYLIDHFHWKRFYAALLPAALMFVLGTFASLSFGPLAGLRFGSMNLFDFLSHVSDRLLLPLGGFFLCIFVGYIWGTDRAYDELSNHGALRFRMRRAYAAVLKYVAPAVILIIFVASFFGI